MKKTLSLILSIIIILSSLTLSVSATNKKEGDILKFNKDGKFTILNISDIQDGYPLNPLTKDYIIATLDKVKPDLIVLTGDNVSGFDIPEENEYYVHRIGRTGRAKRKGVAWSIIGNFPEKAKLDEIAKYSNYTIKPMLLGEDGTLTVEEVKAPVIKKRFR